MTLLFSPQTGHFAVLGYSVMAGAGRTLLRMRNLSCSLTNAVYYHRLVYLEMVFLLNPIDIRCSLARSSSGRRSTLSDQLLYQKFHHLHTAVYDSW